MDLEYFSLPEEKFALFERRRIVIWYDLGRPHEKSLCLRETDSEPRA